MAYESGRATEYAASARRSAMRQTKGQLEAGGLAIGGLPAIGRLPSTAVGWPWYCRGNCPGRSPDPIEASRKADGLRFVLDVT